MVEQRDAFRNKKATQYRRSFTVSRSKALKDDKIANVAGWLTTLVYIEAEVKVVSATVKAGWSLYEVAGQNGLSNNISASTRKVMLGRSRVRRLILILNWYPSRR